MGPLHSRYICRGANWARARPLSHQALRQAVRRSAASVIRRGCTEPGSTARLQVRVAACSLMWRYSESSCESTATPIAHHSGLFLFDFYARSQNCENEYCLRHVCQSVRLSVRIEQLGSHWTDFHGICCLNFEKIKVSLNLIKITGTWRLLGEYLTLDERIYSPRNEQWTKCSEDDQMRRIILNPLPNHFNRIL